MQSQQQGGSGGAGFAAPTIVGSPLDAYAGPADVYDEFRDQAGAVRPAWAEFAAKINKLGSQGLQRRWSQSQRLIYENGVAFSPHGDAEESPRPWALDPIPVVLHRDEWTTVSEGLKQRAHVLEAVLRDLYGPQRLIRTGLLPAELLYAHPGYRLRLREAPNDDPIAPMVRFYAADLGRSPDGKWWVLADRTEAPSGIGFALENRIVVSRMLPEPFRDCHVQRLAGYFEKLRSVLESLAPDGTPNPRVALLSQGPGQPNYFEDAYLARYLGYTLVEGEDLTVRQRRLWLKTLEALTPIDVLVRRPNSDQCDPLELGGESPRGVAGLIETVRGGVVAVANAVGSGLVESPVFMAYMPRLCQELLGEELKLPGVATWWCGDPASLEHVLANLNKLVLKRAYRQRGTESLLTAELRQAPADQLADLIRQDPRAFVAQERVERSSAPIWRDGGFASARIALRAFAVVDEAEVHVLDGALARTTSTVEPLETSILSGEGSKDVWIVGEEPVEPKTLLPDDDEPIPLVRLGSDLPSRVADNAYWLGRHIERADSKARLLRTVAIRLTEERGPEELIELPALLRALAVQGQIEPDYAVDEFRNRLPQVEQSLQAHAVNRQQVGSLASTIERVFNSASKVRDRLSRDSWRTLVRVRGTLRVPGGAGMDLTELINATDELIVDLAAVGGMVVEGLTRTQFYRFLDIGRRIERAVQVVDLLKACLIESPRVSRPLLEAILETSDSLMTYRYRYRANFKLTAVLDLLVTDASNPRSLAFQLETLERHVGKLPRKATEAPGADREQRLAMSMAHAVRMVDPAAVAGSHEMGRKKPLEALLTQLSKDLPVLSDAIALKYLVHAVAARQLSPM